MALINQTTYDKENKIWYGRKTKARFGSKSSVGSVLYQALENNPDHISQICYPSDKKYTNKDILNLSVRVAQHMEKLELKQCEVIGICAGNSDFLAPLVFGCMFKGLTISTLDSSFDKDGIKHIFSITKPKLMFCDGSAYYKVKESFADCGLASTKIITVRDHIDGVPSIDPFLKETGEEHEFRCANLEYSCDQTAAIICSSGTSGLPKGVCISHVGILNMITLPTYIQNILCFSSLHWISGIYALINCTIDNFTRVISYRPFNAEDALEVIKRYDIDLFLGPPNQLANMLGSPKFHKDYLLSVKLYFILGSPLPFELVGKLKNHLPDASVYVSYGLSETCGGISGGFAHSQGNCGQLFDNIEVKVVDDNDRQLRVLEVGEIYSRTQYQWSGYYGNLQETLKIYDSDRWIHTGDLGYVDDSGCVYVIDRKKDILKYNNFHFSPSEIENVILQLNGIVEVCVCGIPDVTCNFLPAAAVVKSANSFLTENEICEHVKKMAHFNHLRGGVYFINEIPKTISGKVLRRKVVELVIELYNATRTKSS